jgi:NDP-sugar pyrophosphorylase family protein
VRSGDPGARAHAAPRVDACAGLHLHLESLRSSKPDELASGPSISGNVLMAPGATVGSGAKIGPDVSIGEGCVIGDGVRLSNCVIMKGVKARGGLRVAGAYVMRAGCVCVSGRRPRLAQERAAAGVERGRGERVRATQCAQVLAVACAVGEGGKGSPALGAIASS